MIIHAFCEMLLHFFCHLYCNFIVGHNFVKQCTITLTFAAFRLAEVGLQLDITTECRFSNNSHAIRV